MAIVPYIYLRVARCFSRGRYSTLPKLPNPQNNGKNKAWIEINANGVRVENEKAFGGQWLAVELVKLLGLRILQKYKKIYKTNSSKRCVDTFASTGDIYRVGVLPFSAHNVWVGKVNINSRNFT